MSAPSSTHEAARHALRILDREAAAALARQRRGWADEWRAVACEPSGKPTQLPRPSDDRHDPEPDDREAA